MKTITISGPTGSGKSFKLENEIKKLVESYVESCEVITIEDVNFHNVIKEYLKGIIQ